MKCMIFVLLCLGCPERSKGWAHMQSVHAGAVQTHSSVFTVFLKSAPEDTIFAQYWRHCSYKVAILNENK